MTETERPQGEVKQLEGSLEFETLISDLSSRFVNLPPGEIDERYRGFAAPSLRVPRRRPGCAVADPRAPKGRRSLATHLYSAGGRSASAMLARTTGPTSASRCWRAAWSASPLPDDLPPEAVVDRENDEHVRSPVEPDRATLGREARRPSAPLASTPCDRGATGQTGSSSPSGAGREVFAGALWRASARTRRCVRARSACDSRRIRPARGFGSSTTPRVSSGPPRGLATCSAFRPTSASRSRRCGRSVHPDDWQTVLQAIDGAMAPWRFRRPRVPAPAKQRRGALDLVSSADPRRPRGGPHPADWDLHRHH